ncbi:DL-endopeptidase inhibitor IseA family protein [Brevibacillus fulvus]|uniref:Glucose/arabinose dehydrogenase n=1 Tax=Brevibacillus fulvus TaxID=1125967 RepID=A0A938Y1D4_9BACL|nr:DL-endopeptidase inhibitor IseA family protein [Brevibacillus fulvus]MBM7589812.1 glucose/arabinose dehydrogenase [Brevibacillus fulvus]
MKNKTKGIILLFSAFLLLAAAGCGQSKQAQTTEQPAAAEQPTDQQDQSTQPPTPPQQAPADGAAEQASVPPVTEMNEQAAVKLVTEGMKRYWHVMSGGEGAGGTTDGGPIATVTVNGQEYRYLGSDLETKEKLTAYLAQVYTPEAIAQLLKDANLVEHEGKMVQPNADGGSMLRWEDALASLIDGNEESKQYELKVPYGEGNDVEFAVVEVDMKKLAQGWLINTSPAQLH